MFTLAIATKTQRNYFHEWTDSIWYRQCSCIFWTIFM